MQLGSTPRHSWTGRAGAKCAQKPPAAAPTQYGGGGSRSEPVPQRTNTRPLCVGPLGPSPIGGGGRAPPVPLGSWTLVVWRVGGRGPASLWVLLFGAVGGWVTCPLPILRAGVQVSQFGGRSVTVPRVRGPVCRGIVVPWGGECPGTVSPRSASPAVAGQVPSLGRVPAVDVRVGQRVRPGVVFPLGM